VNTLTVTHNSGFFSCCCVRLVSIVNYFNHNKKLPDIVDSSKQFDRYKTDKTIDYTPIFYKTLDYEVPYHENLIVLNEKRELQFSNYNLINFDKLMPIFNKYFTISDQIECIVNNLSTKYNLDYNNTCAILYRGNDKNRETIMPKYDVYFSKAKEIQKNNPNIKFFVQTDETEFLKKFIEQFPESIYFNEMPTLNRSDASVHKILYVSERKNAAMNYLSAVVCVSKCKYVLTHTGNCGLFAVLFRGNKNNVYQYFTESLANDNNKYSYVLNNVSGDTSIRNTWI